MMSLYTWLLTVLKETKQFIMQYIGKVYLDLINIPLPYDCILCEYVY